MLATYYLNFGGIRTHVGPSNRQIRREEEKNGRNDHICDPDLPLLASTRDIIGTQRTRLAVHPTNPDSLNGRDSGSIVRPRIQLIAMGIPYETPRATTDADMMALKALQVG